MTVNFSKNQQGFTLIEILMSISIFSLLVFAVAGIYIAFNNSQIRTTASQQLLNDSQYAFELMAREIRTSAIVHYEPATQAWCESVIKTWASNYIFDSCIILERENGQVFALTKFKYSASNDYSELRYISLNNCGDDYMSCDSWQNNYLASTILLSPVLNNVSVDSLDFFITPTTDPFVAGGPNQQPKVTIKMETSYYSANKFKNVKHTFQTTVSSRIYRR